MRESKSQALLPLIDIVEQDFCIRNIGLSEEGKREIRFARQRMIGLLELERMYTGQEPLKGRRITVCVTVTYETAVFVLHLKKLGANVRVCPDNPIGSRDPACAYLASQGISVFAWEGMTESDLYWSFEKAIRFKGRNGDPEGPEIVIDDGCDITRYLHKHHPEVYKGLFGTVEQTECGTNEHRKLRKRGELKTAVIDIDGCAAKKIADNHSGCRQSLIEGLQQSVNMSLTGKIAAVFGFSFAGRGCAFAFAGFGMQVWIVETSPFKAQEALMNGYRVVSKNEACKEADILITATGCIKTIAGRDFLLLKDGAVLANMGHGNMEIDTKFLYCMPLLGREEVNKFAEKLKLPNGRDIYLLCEGRLVNMAVGGHPPEVMSITFTLHTLAILDLLRRPSRYVKGNIYQLSKELDAKAILLNYPFLRSKLTRLTREQANYLGVNQTCEVIERQESVLMQRLSLGCGDG